MVATIHLQENPALETPQSLTNDQNTGSVPFLPRRRCYGPAKAEHVQTQKQNVILAIIKFPASLLHGAYQSKCFAHERNMA